MPRKKQQEVGARHGTQFPLRRQDNTRVPTGGATGPPGPTGPPGADTWGSITGTLSTQADLATALAGKAASVHTHAEADVTGLVADLAAKAPLSSPALTGTPTAPTAAPGTNTTQLATTAFALAEAALQSGATATSTITTTGTQTALAIPTGTGDLILRANNATLLNVQGIAAGIDGQRLVIESVGAGQVDFNHQHASATAANRLINVATVGLTSLAAGSGVAVFVYDGTIARWRLVAHEQGAFIDVPFSAGNFTGSGAMTWTVDSGDQVAFAYLLIGSTLLVVFTLKTTSIGGTPDIALQIAVPAGLAARLKVGTNFPYLGPLVPGVGVIEVLANATLLQLYTDYSAAAWPASTNSTYLEGSITFQVK